MSNWTINYTGIVYNAYRDLGINYCIPCFISSPIGEVFRSRLRQFPSLVTCCTIDWFSEWPDEALRSVASSFLQDITEIDNPDSIQGLVSKTNSRTYMY